MGAYLVTADGLTTLTFDLVVKEDWDESANVTDYSVEIGADVTDNVRVKTAVCTLQVFATNEPLGVSNWAVPQLELASINAAAPSGQAPLNVTKLSVPGWDNGIALRAALMGVGDLIGGAAGGPVGTAVGGAVGALAGALIGGPGPTTITASPNVGLQPSPAQIGNATTLQFAQSQDFITLTLNQLRAWKDASQLLTCVGTKNSVANMIIEEFKTGADNETSGRTVMLTLRQLRIVTTTTVALPAPTVPRAAAPVSKGTVATVPVKDSLAYQAAAGSVIGATNGGPPVTGNLSSP